MFGRTPLIYKENEHGEMRPTTTPEFVPLVNAIKVIDAAYCYGLAREAGMDESEAYVESNLECALSTLTWIEPNADGAERGGR